MTDRQYRAWLQWLEEQKNVPSRADYYAMRIAQRVAGGNATIEEQKVVFEKPIPAPKLTKEQESAQWLKERMARIGGRMRTWKDGKLVFMDEL